MEEYLKATASMGHLISKFILEQGKAYSIGPKTFKGRRMKQGMCYMNATHRALGDSHLKYVEGIVSVYGVPINHAWNVDLEGNLIDPTLKNDDGRVVEYYGVDFSPDYLEKATLLNGYYGLLDGYYARKTIKDLIDGKAIFR